MEKSTRSDNSKCDGLGLDILEEISAMDYAKLSPNSKAIIGNIRARAEPCPDDL